MTHGRTLATLLAALATIACGDDPVATPTPPRIDLQPSAVSFGSQVGAVVSVRALVSGLGPSPVIRWTSLDPSIVVENGREGGTVVDLRAVASVRTGAGIEVRATGTATVADTVVVTMLAASRRP